jgi:hydrogenase expression/formation protein HypE
MNRTNDPRPPRSDPSWSQITRAHGGGGLMTDALVAGTILPRLGNELLEDLLDASHLDVDRGKLAFTIDSYVVQPIRFPGGDIGRLAISGTVNDLSVAGARPIAIALGLILSEGLPRATLEAVLDSLADTAREADVRVVTGDTKVIGHADEDTVFMVTAGVGAIRADLPAPPHPKRIEPGDAILINGTVADHGVAVMLAREMPQVKSAVRSDVAPLNGLIHGLLDRVPGVKFMRDATRAGLSGLCADVAARTGLHFELDEDAIAVRPETLHAAEMLGLDPLDVANEGKFVAVVRDEDAPAALAAMRDHPLGRNAAVIGRVTGERDGICELRTTIGGRRMLLKPYGEQLPRIC